VAWVTVSLARVPVPIRPAIVVTVAVIGAVSIVVTVPIVMVTLVPGMRRVATDRVSVVMIALIPFAGITFVTVIAWIEIHSYSFRPATLGRRASVVVASGSTQAMLREALAAGICQGHEPWQT
jgi:hypothetical protein